MLFNPILLWLMMVCSIVSLIYLVSIFFFQSESTIQSNLSFECGMDPIHFNNVPVSIHFFLVSIIFLIFDIEFVITIPLIFSSVSFLYWMMFWYVYMFVVFAGLVVELKFGTLDWKE